MKKTLILYIFISIFYCCNTTLKDPYDKIKLKVSSSLDTYHLIQNRFIQQTKAISGDNFLDLKTIKNKTDISIKRKKIADLDSLINGYENRILRAHKIYTDSYLSVINTIKEDSSKYYFDTLKISDIEAVAVKNIDDMYIHTKDFIQAHKNITSLWKQYFNVIEDCGSFTNDGVKLNTAICVEDYNYVVNKLLDIEYDINKKWGEEKIWDNWRGYVSGK